MPVVVLIGPPGSGKSTVGELLAERLGVGFRDTDLDAEQVAGKPIGEIFFDDGEEAFRAIEAEAVAKALAEHPGVLSLGGGSILNPATRELLAGHTVVYLKVGLDHAIKRVGLASARPLLVLNPRSQMRKLMEERRPLYEALAVITVVTDDLEAPEVVDHIAAELKPEAE
ncbi:shikimate kinase [Herbidospora sp. RD11066]